MKKSLRHLPVRKREALKEITETIRELADPEMIILFGSHARGDWVEDSYMEGHITYTYVSDYDILVVTEKKRGHGFESFLKSKARQLVDGSGFMRVPVTIISHDIKFINKKLEIGSYFFCDVKKEGIMLYDSGKYKLASPKPMSPKQRQKRMREDFKHWFKSSEGFYAGTGFYLERKDYNLAAFNLHQATERLYHTILLVFTGKKPKLHDVEELGCQVAQYSMELQKVFPKTTPEQKRLFKLLKDAYVGARYDKNYSITPEELEYLSGCVKNLQDLTEKLCKAKIKSIPL